MVFSVEQGFYDKQDGVSREKAKSQRAEHRTQNKIISRRDGGVVDGPGQKGK